MLSSWRMDFAIPMLKKHGIEFFNPKDEEWCPELVGREVKAKENSAILIYVLDQQSRGISSMLEAADLIINGRTVVLVMSDFDKGVVIAGHAVSAAQLSDLNVGRSFLKDIAMRNSKNCDLFSEINEAMEFIVSTIQNMPTKVDKICQTTLTSLTVSTKERSSEAQMTSPAFDSPSVFSPAPSPEWPPFRPCPLEISVPNGGPVTRSVFAPVTKSVFVRGPLSHSPNSAFDVVPPLATRKITTVANNTHELKLPFPQKQKR